MAGEPSGDQHAAKLVHGLRALDSSPQFMGTGGEAMEKAGVNLVRHLDKMSFMGFTEVVKNIFTIRENFHVVKEQLLDFHPDILILVDYPGFNLRLATWAKEQGFKVAYYIAPQAWAWNEKRVEQIRASVDLLLVILPFEQKWFAERKVSSKYVGHPSVEQIQTHPLETEQKTKVALLPGSRKQEIERLLPIMLDAMNLQTKQELVVAGMSLHGAAYYERIIKGRATLVMDNMHEVLASSRLAIVASGTATIEAALMNVPQVVCYKGGWLNYYIAKRLIKVPHISLVNLVLQRALVPELIQGNCTAVTIKQASMEVAQNQHAIEEGYVLLQRLLGKGETSKKAALHIFEFINK